MWDIWFAERGTHLDVGDREIEAAIEVAAGITADALERRG
jgi:hypothetical protein